MPQGRSRICTILPLLCAPEFGPAGSQGWEIRAAALLRLISGPVEPRAPLLVVELRRFGVLKESLQYRDEALRRLELRQMADPVEDLEWVKTAGQILDSIRRYCQRINQTGH